MHRILYLLMLPALACRSDATSPPSGGELGARWSGSSSGSFRASATARWCARDTLLELLAVRNDTAVDSPSSPRTPLAPASTRSFPPRCSSRSGPRPMRRFDGWMTSSSRVSRGLGCRHTAGIGSIRRLRHLRGEAPSPRQTRHARAQRKLCQRPGGPGDRRVRPGQSAGSRVDFPYGRSDVFPEGIRAQNGDRGTPLHGLSLPSRGSDPARDHVSKSAPSPSGWLGNSVSATAWTARWIMPMRPG